MLRFLFRPGAQVPRPPVWRRLFHMAACSSIPLVGIYASETFMVALLAALAGVALALEGARLMVPSLNRLLVRWLRHLLKESEGRRLTGATYIALSSLLVFLVFDKQVAVTAMFFLALGDPVAALVGSRAWGPRILGKSPWGTLGFVVASLAIAGVLAAGDVISFQSGVVVGAVVGAVVELVPLVVDDNVSVPLASGTAMALLGV